MSMSPSGEKAGDSSVWAEFLGAWRVIYKRKWAVLATAIITFAIVYGRALRQAPMYQAQATVIIDPSAPRLLGQTNEVLALGTGVSGMYASQDYYNTQQRILQSRSLAEQVVRERRLQNDPRLVGPIGDLAEAERLQRAASLLQGAIRVLPVRDSRVFGIGIRHRDPKFAAELANAVAVVFTAQNIDRKLEITGKATEWLTKQADKAERRLKAAEGALNEFRVKHHILTVALADSQNELTTQHGDFKKAQMETRRARIDAEARRQAIFSLAQATALDAPLPKSAGTAALEALRSAYMEERRKLVLAEQRYGDRHHEVIYARTRTAEAKADFDREAGNLLKGLDAELQALTTAEQRFGTEANAFKTQALALSQKEVEFKTLLREATDAEQQYNALQKRLNESTLQVQDEANNIRLLDRAEAPTVPVEPNLSNALIVGICLAFFFSLSLTYLLHLLDRTVRTQEDVESTTGFPVLGFVPTLAEPEPTTGDVRDIYILKHPASTAAEACRVIRTNVIFSSPDKPFRALVVTSSSPVEGKTTSVLNLGIVMAQAGHRTLVVDSDMRRPRLHRILKVSNERGLSSLIVGECQPEDAIKSTDLPNLSVLPCGPLPPNPAELLQSEKFAAVKQDLLSRFDRVIFDSPPLLAVTDGALLSREVDGTVLVVRAGKTTKEALVRARRQVAAVGAHVAGVVVNDVNLKNSSYSDYYYYYHHYYQQDRPATAASGSAGDKT
jgi:capsular exopolysaccharide synthesis family protein